MDFLKRFGRQNEAEEKADYREIHQDGKEMGGEYI